MVSFNGWYRHRLALVFAFLVCILGFYRNHESGGLPLSDKENTVCKALTGGGTVPGAVTVTAPNQAPQMPVMSGPLGAGSL